MHQWPYLQRNDFQTLSNKPLSYKETIIIYHGSTRQFSNTYANNSIFFNISFFIIDPIYGNCLLIITRFDITFFLLSLLFILTNSTNTKVTVVNASSRGIAIGQKVVLVSHGVYNSMVLYLNRLHLKSFLVDSLRLRVLLWRQFCLFYTHG